MKIAVTGGTGFVGAHFIDAAIAAGHRVRALARRPQAARQGVEWVAGSLEDEASLELLVEDSETIVHIAGVINAADELAFEAGNVDGTARLIAAAGSGRLVYVSSLAAREPNLSQYGGSKARAEDLVRLSGTQWTVVRPPAVYGPGDKETLELFRMAKLRLMLLPSNGRTSMIHVTDLARLLLALAPPGTAIGETLEPDDGRADGWSHRELAAALGDAVGRANLAIRIPPPVLRLGAFVDQLVRRGGAKLSPDRAAYFSHDDWVADPALRPSAQLWSPQISTDRGLADTARWYVANGWL